MKKLLTAFLLLLPFVSMAHGYWLEVQGSGKIKEPATIKLFFGEFENQKRETGKLLDRMAEIKIYVIDANLTKTEVALTQTTTHWEGSFTPQTQGTYQIIGLNETRQVQDWTKHNLGIVRPIQYLRTSYQVGKQVTTPAPGHFIDVLPGITKDKVNLSVWKNNHAFVKSRIRIINPEGWVKEHVVQDNNQIGFTPTSKGVYVVELEYVDKTAGTFQGKEYESVRYRCDTSFRVE